MPMRTRQFSKFPWTGGLNTSVDPALLDPNDLVQGDNIIFTTQGTRKKRDGINYNWDDLNIASISRASSGVNRTLVTSGYPWKTGERFAVSGMPAAYNSTAATVTATDSTNKSTVTFSVASPGKVNWAAHGLAANDPVAFRTTGTLPAELTVDKIYFVKNPNANDFEVSEEPGLTSINFAGAGSGTHTGREYLEDIITYTFSGATSLTESTTADSSGNITLREEAICEHDYWYDDGSSKTHKLIVMTSAGRLWSINLSNGIRTIIYDTGTAYTSLPLTTASMVTFDNRLMVATEGQNNVMKYMFPSTLGGTGVLADVINQGSVATPKPSILQTHLGRLWCNDKANFDRLHYCETGVYNRWQGQGDSGALDVSQGDGDPKGLSAIFPPFKGDLIVSKRTKLYRILGVSPDDFQLIKLTDGVGCVGQQSVTAVDQDDIIFVSDNGVHSLNATSAYGSFSGAYLSSAIQGSINDTWNKTQFSRIKATYVSELNSVAFTVPEAEDITPTNLWFYNVPLKRWYRWPDVDCASIAVVRDTDRQRLYIGTSQSRIGRTLSGFNYDVDFSGDDQAVDMTLKTGRIFPDNSPTTIKAFKQFALIYKPTGTYNITATIKIDNFSSQSLLFSQSSGSEVLDVDFVLGVSAWGGERVAQAFVQTLDGYGRGFQVTINQSGVNEFGEILGFQVMYEPAEWPQETRSGDDS